MSNNFIIDYNGRTSIDASVNSLDAAGAELFLNGSGLYEHNIAGNSSGFYRLISIVDNGNYIAASSTVRWKKTGNNRIFRKTCAIHQKCFETSGG